MGIVGPSVTGPPLTGRVRGFSPASTNSRSTARKLNGIESFSRLCREQNVCLLFSRHYRKKSLGQCARDTRPCAACIARKIKSSRLHRSKKRRPCNRQIL